MTFFHCFDCRKDGNDGKRALSSSAADGRGSRPKASQREAKAMIALLYSILCASSSQCSPRLVCRCVRTSQVHPLCPTSSKCARLRRAFHCDTISPFLPPVHILSSSLPSSRCGKSLRRSHFIFFYLQKEKRKRRNMRHASLNTH